MNPYRNPKPEPNLKPSTLYPADTMQIGRVILTPGCICPPGANLTCEAADCPRKAR